MIISDYLPSLQPCKWEENTMSVTGAKVYGECVNVQPKFSLTVALLIALLACIIAAAITTLFSPVFDILNVDNLGTSEDHHHDISKREEIGKVVPIGSTKKGIILSKSFYPASVI